MEAEVFQRMALQETRHWWFCARRQILGVMLESFKPAGNSLEILEAGCGTGGNLAMLDRLGRISAFELDESAREVARSRGFQVHPGALPDRHPFVDRQFDLIALFDVLEHVEADQASLDALARMLKPGGRIAVTVPAFPSLWSSHDVLHHHFRRYRRAGLRHQLQLAGLRVVRLTHYNFWLFPAVVFIRVLKKVNRSPHSDEESIPPAWLNSILRITYSSERFLLPWISFPFGVSLLAIAERPNT